MKNVLAVLIKDLEDELRSSGNNIWNKRVDIEKCLQIISRIKKEFPQKLSEADLIVTEKDKIIENARNQAENIVMNAKQQAAFALSNTSLKHRAQDTAMQMCKNAETACNVIAENNREIIVSMHENFEKFLLDMMEQARQNKYKYQSAAAPIPKRKATYKKN